MHSSTRGLATRKRKLLINAPQALAKGLYLIERIIVLDEVKTHIGRHKVLYSTVLIAGITCVIMRGRIVGLALRGPNGLETADTLVTNRPLFSFYPKQSVVIIRQEIGRPPYLIHDTTSNLYYRSQSRVADALRASNSTVSRHLNGKRAHVSGHQLERVFIS